VDKPKEPKAAPAVVFPHTPENLRQLATRLALEAGTNPSEMLRVINCENRAWNPKLQSGIKYKPGNRWGMAPGTYEKSFGLAMIHLPDHPNITYEQATDATWALTWMAREFKKNPRQWSCY
jgi:hypothetical protein